MKGYAETHVFSSAQLEKLDEAREVVRAFPSKVQGSVLRCHEVARAVGCALELAVIDGKYGPVEHSWCLTYGENGGCILDPYAVARLPQVQLVSSVPGIGFTPYVGGEKRTDVNQDVLRELVAVAVQVVRRRVLRKAEEAKVCDHCKRLGYGPRCHGLCPCDCHRGGQVAF